MIDFFDQCFIVQFVVRFLCVFVGDRLDRHLFGSAPRDRRHLLELCQDLCKAVKLLHSLNVGHGDLALRNVFVCTSAQLKLLDFELAYNDVDVRGQQAHRRRPLLESAPEVLLDERFYLASDVWSVGVAIWSILSSPSFRSSEEQQVTLWRHVARDAHTAASKKAALLATLTALKETASSTSASRFVPCCHDKSLTPADCVLLHAALHPDHSKRCGVRDLLDMMGACEKKVSLRLSDTSSAAYDGTPANDGYAE